MTYTYTIDEIKTMYSNGVFTFGYNESYKRKLPDDYVISEDLTIKENRERIKQHNKKVDQFYREQKTKQAELTDRMRYFVREAIVVYYGMNKQQASIVEEYCWSNFHHYVREYLDHADWLSELTQQVLEASK